MHNVNHTHVATIIANPETLPLNQAEVDSVIDALRHNGALVDDIDWLAEGTACDLFFSALPEAEASNLLEHLLAEVPFDAVVQPAHDRKKNLLICDMDSTIITVECIDELADFAGIKDHVARITARAMNGELDFEAALKERVALLKGLDTGALAQAYKERVTITPGAICLVSTMKHHGAMAVLVSGGFTFFTERVAAEVGFDYEEANGLEIENNQLTGNVIEPILGKEAKLAFLREYAQQKDIPHTQVMAVGDGANDLPMLQAAGIGVAYHAKPHVREQVVARIDHCDLSSLLYVQGYHADEILDGKDV